MITIETICAFALRDRTVMDSLGEALRSDLVLANPFLRQLATFADDFLGEYGQMPKAGDWAVWLETLPEAQADGCKETLGRLQTVNISEYQPQHFAEKVLPELQKAATKTAISRLNSLQGDVPPEALGTLAEKVASVSSRSISGLAHLSDVDIWSIPEKQQDLTPTGFPKLDEVIGGWGKELWMILADAKAGKSMLLQNCTTNVATKGKRCLHVSLELGLRPQIQRYYRQIAQAERGEFVTQQDAVKRRIRHWLRLAQGEVHVIQYPAYQITPEELGRVIERLARTLGDIDFLTLDYLDLLAPPETTGRGGNRYQDLGHITHMVRSFCDRFDMTVLTATQAVRPQSGKKRERLATKDIGDSYEKVRGVDGLLGLTQTEEEAEIFQGQLDLLVTRDSGGMGRRFPVYINRDLSLIQDLDHDNTKELMRQLGHLKFLNRPGVSVK